jgi:hypothetical protein
VGSRHIARNEQEKDMRNITDEMGISHEEQNKWVKSIINKMIEKHLIMEYGQDQGITFKEDVYASFDNEGKAT